MQTKPCFDPQCPIYLYARAVPIKRFDRGVKDKFKAVIKKKTGRFVEVFRQRMVIGHK